MGYTCHHAIIVSCNKIENLNIAHSKAIEILHSPDPDGCSIDLVSNICGEGVNGICSFFIAPDGSNEWWPTSDFYNEKRQQFIEWLKENNNYDWVLIQYGD